MSPLLYEILIIKIFFDDDVHQSESKGSIRPGTNRQIHFSLFRKGNSLGVYHHNFRSHWEIFLNREVQGKIRLLGIVAPENIKSRILFFNRILSESHLPRPNTHAIAD